MNRDYFSAEYDQENELDTCRFWMMLKMKFGEYYQKRYELYLLNLKDRLLEMNPNPLVVKKEIYNLQMSAYRTIPSTFY